MRNRTLVRLAVLVLACYTMLPFQLVWCQTDCTAPRMEFALNGQCLTGTNTGCCTSNASVAMPVGQAVDQQTSLTLGDHHDDCVGCSDKLAHSQRTFTLTRPLNESPCGIEGGNLYCLVTRWFREGPAGGQVERQGSRLETFAPGTMHLQTIQLLI